MHQLKGHETIMKITTLRRLLTVVLCLALAVGAISMTACGKKSPTLLELDGNRITANQYQFLLSRVKGSLHYTGYNVESDNFWNMIIDDQNTTYDEFFRNAVLEDARRYLCCALEGVGDSLPGLENWIMGEISRGTLDTPQQVAQQLAAVTAQDVREMLSRFRLSVVYTLTAGGECHE